MKAPVQQKYTTIVLYKGEIARYPNDVKDCWEFDSIKAACQSLVDEGYAKNLLAARTGLSNMLNSKIRHYRGFTVSVAYKEGRELDAFH